MCLCHSPCVQADETSDETGDTGGHCWMRRRECFKVTWSMPPVTVPECAELYCCIDRAGRLVISQSSGSGELSRGPGSVPAVPGGAGACPVS